MAARSPKRPASARRHIPTIAPALVQERLNTIYGPIEWHPHRIALDQLINTVLSQHTSDLNADRAYDSLRKALPTWGEVIEAETATVVEAIRHGGLANQKAPRIQQILVEILKRLGHFELEFLAGLPLEEAREWLTSLPGVGPKTAAVVMSFSLHMPAFPVDTHIHRVSKRLGFITEKTTADQAHPIMEALIPEDERYEMHVLLITHGRQICKARIPQCVNCPLAKKCAASTMK
ncbi:MAG: endonuclease III [Dehalococcoidia bacterium]|jgi:endonuclease-3|nr:DNA lyase [Chloroflexota bacterium]MDP6055902.1 endonuclease III [Dehalococcoidia bacterium]MDP7089718.1 endonuclease III [Dehalococcoidia bacterium]MDP7261900.1 endonuclease III [Dehalococcoidia bacterium]MDP7485840.1 endonuclease III [Dehalococcoidia bacterium]|tara:strand:+ start:267 stop:968 length:702 start_codon:yes stop_codon:yes gene_type:complete